MITTIYAKARPVLVAAVATASMLTAGAASAVVAETNNKGILGIEMTFGTKLSPEIFAGFVHASKSSSDHYSGAKALVYWDFVQGLMPGIQSPKRP